jgi:hypothetical protein
VGIEDKAGSSMPSSRLILKFILSAMVVISEFAVIVEHFLQVVVSKAREHTVLVHAPCPFALPIQP